MRSLAAATLVALTLTVPAMAQDTPYPDFDHRGKPTTLHGQGGLSCGKFLADREPLALGNGGHAQQMGWLLGYLYGMDAWNPYTVRTYDYNGLNAWLVEYCRTHPLDQLVNAGLKFYVYYRRESSDERHGLLGLAAFPRLHGAVTRHGMVREQIGAVD